MEGQSDQMGFSEDQTIEENKFGGDDSGGNDHSDTVPNEEQAEEPSQSSMKKRKAPRKYHRHTPQQIQDLENFFKNCAHPDEKQRLELGRRLGLNSKQIKFWFQNRRTQLKSQMERNENIMLKQEYDKLRAEYMALREAMMNPVCHGCGGPAVPPELPAVTDQKLKLENARLKEELMKICTVTEKLVGRPVSTLFSQMRGENSGLDLSMGRANGPPNGPIGMQVPFPSMGHTPDQNVMNSLTNALDGGAMTNEHERAVFVQAAIEGMDELLALAQPDCPLWVKGMDGGREMLIYDEYAKKKCQSYTSLKTSGFITDATRERITVMIDSAQLVDTLMTPSRWQELFPCMVGKATTVEVLIPGTGGTKDGEVQLMNAELIFPSPHVPLRQEKIMRFAKQILEGMWSVVDVAVDSIRESSFSASTVKCRRFPSGCIVQDVGNGHSLVTWIEHWEYDENVIHELFRSATRSGLAFGAQRWLATLRRECECAAIFMSSVISPASVHDPVTPAGRGSILKLAKRLSRTLCSSLCASSVHLWEKHHINGGMADLVIMSRVSINEPGEPSGLVMSASTSVWLPVPRQDLYAFLKDEKERRKWDVLANSGPMEVLASLPKSQDGVNSVTLLCPAAAPSKENSMLIVQESWSDETNSMIMYAPVDLASIDTVLRGGDSDYIALLPSGFTIADGPILANDGVGARAGASVLTLGYQILVSSDPTSKLIMEPINTVNRLLGHTIQKIRDSVGAN